MEEKYVFSYYNFIMGDSSESIKNTFHEKWISYLNSIPFSYSKAIQLRIGNHLRPLLVYWGSALGAASKDDINLNEVTELAICVETLHKVSIIIDDLIDKDTKRHHRAAFHIQFSPEETIIFAVYMLGQVFEKINTVSSKFPSLHKEFINLYTITLQTMANGCLQELTLTPEEYYNLQKISNIICMETSTLIKNSLLIGFSTNSNSNAQISELVESIGDKVGYLFQVMNDLEPFCFQENLILHKGTMNMDFERSRKNIVLPYIYGVCSTSEKKKLIRMHDNTESLQFIVDLYQKYQVRILINKDLQNIEEQIENAFEELSHLSINRNCLKDFHIFFEDILKIGKSRLKNINQEPID